MAQIGGLTVDLAQAKVMEANCQRRGRAGDAWPPEGRAIRDGAVTRSQTPHFLKLFAFCTATVWAFRCATCSVER